jgi:uncharacterized protein (TIGR02118 family)
MAAHVYALYNHPADPAAFDAYYSATHVPIVKKIPGLGSFCISKGPISTPAGPAPYYFIADLTFDSTAAVQAAFASAEGAAAAADLQNFATGGVTLLFFESAEA